jgi:hypothetical protein
MAKSSKLESLLALARLIAPNAKRVAAEVTQAVEQPATYFKAHRKRLDDRNIDKPTKDLPWIALVDALTVARSLVEIDWKTSGEDIAWNLEKLVPKKTVAWLAKIDPVDDDRSTLELLELTGQKLLASDKLQLASLDIGSDSFCLVVVPADRAKTLVASAKAAGYGSADLFTGKGLAAATHERVARDKRNRKEAEREAKRQANAVDDFIYFARGNATWYLTQAQLAFDTGYEAPKVKFYRNHYFKDARQRAAAAKKQISEWKSEGFRSVDRATYLSLAKTKGAYIGWVAPFPTAAHYWLENKKIVRCLALEGDAVVSLNGMVGRSFGELQSYTHFKSAELAATDHAATVARYNATSFYKPITRDAVVKLYK